MHQKDSYVARWHLPSDFDQRTTDEQNQITIWVKENTLSSTTDFGKFLSRVSKERYAILFPNILRTRKHTPAISLPKIPSVTGNLRAPPALSDEMEKLLEYHTSTLSPAGFKRYMRWKSQTVVAHVRNFGIMFGALSANPASPIGGLGIPLPKLTFGLFVFPQIWDWLLQWRERRRGFFTVAERSTLYVAIGFTRRNTGWIRQHPGLAKQLKPIPGVLSEREIQSAKNDWDKVCDNTFEFAKFRLREISRLMRCHRDFFVPILPILKSSSPLSEFRKITEEIIGRVSELDNELERAKAIRSYLMLRLGAHLGLRQRNLRQLLLAPKGSKHRAVKELEELERGEMRWNEEKKCWTVFAPAIAFKNYRSSFFKGHPYQLDLPDLANLHAIIDRYITSDRPMIINGRADPGTVFVRGGRYPLYCCEFTMHMFYDAWKLAIQRYGIFNPYTGRGAIRGLLPHGPHCVRDILATHILKQTGSFDLASYAIQDTAETVMRHYGRFLPEEKSAQAALILNEVWDDTKTPGDWIKELINIDRYRIAP